MSRLVLALPLLGALLGAPSLAHADAMDGVCVVVQDHAFEVGLLDSVDPAELQTEDTMPLPGAPDAGGHLLCTRSDDPRCSPLQASDTPVSPEMPARLEAMPNEAPHVPPSSLRPTTFGSGTLLGPSYGPVPSTYRPPRR